MNCNLSRHLVSAWGGLLALSLAACTTPAELRRPSTNGTTPSSGAGAGGTETTGGTGGNFFDFGDGGPTADCSAPQVSLLASALSAPTLMALDESTLYYLSPDLGGDVVHIMALPKSGGVSAEIAPATEGTPIQVIADTTHIYWHASLGLAPSTQHVLYSVLKTGGPVTPLYTSSTAITSLVVDDQDLFWIEQGAIWRMPREGGAAILTGGGGDAYVGSNLALDGDLIYCPGGKGIVAIQKNHVGEGVGSLPTQTSSPDDTILLDPTSLIYIAYGPDHKIVSLARKGWTATTVTVDDLGMVGLAQSAACLYWATSDVGEIHAGPKTGGKHSVIFPNPGGAKVHFLADDTGVYWAEPDSGTISRATK